jgi:hypothetical protein
MIRKSHILVAALFSMAALLTPEPAMALTYVVVQNTTQCPSDTVNFPCDTNLSDAISRAVAGDSIKIKPGTYPGPFTINQNIASFSGDETARTVLTSNGSGAALTVSNVTASINIRRLNFANAQTGILVQNSPSVTITNNIFQVGTNNTAVQLITSPNARITNNTFFQDANGISSDQIAVNIENNIFSSQFTTAISPNVAVTGILSNLFFNCTSIGPPISFDPTDTVNYKQNLQNQDPLFVNSSSSDFHLQAGSPCINTGNASAGLNTIGDPTHTDMGAYGGNSMDIVPFPVSGVTSATSASASIFLRWKPNNSYQVSGYRVYYGSASGSRSGTGATEGNSGFNVTTASATVSGLTTTVAMPATPALNPPQALNESLALSWSAVPSAKRYNVYYGTTSPPGTLAATVDTTSYTLTGLTNGQKYYVSVSAVDQAIYYFTITAFDSFGVASGPTVTPGLSHESDYSGEVSVSIGNAVEGSLSNIVSDFPETLRPYPALPEGHQGCFIATAAYGHYSDPEVQALRAFRDQYLLTNSLGRAFVGWYYRFSPAAAAALNAHPALKPVIRAALLPAVGGACLLTRTSLLFKISLLMVFGCALLFLFNRKRFLRFGGNR